MRRTSPELRAARRRRVVDEMERHDLDALVLGREGNCRYVSGAARLWVSGGLAWMPSTILVRATGSVHLMSTTADGVPEEIPHDHLWALAWNPMGVGEVFARIDGLAEARRIGIDGMSPVFAQVLPALLPDAELVDGETAMRSARRTKLPEELELLGASAQLSRRALEEAADSARPGVPERALLGAFVEAIGRLGEQIPAAEGVFCVADDPPRRMPGDRVIAAGDRVWLASAALVDGYEGGVGATVVAGDGGLGPNDLDPAVLAACRPRASGAELLAAAGEAGLLAHGVGLGVEPPVITAGRGVEAVLEEGMVLAVETWDGGELRRSTVAVTPRGGVPV